MNKNKYLFEAKVSKMEAATCKTKVFYQFISGFGDNNLIGVFTL